MFQAYIERKIIPLKKYFLFYILLYLLLAGHALPSD